MMEKMSDVGIFLPCAQEELVFDTSSFDPHACIWDSSDNFANSILLTDEVNMVKLGKKYYTISRADSSSMFVFEVKNEPQKHFWKPTAINPKNNDSLYMVRVSECFDMDNGRDLGRDKNGTNKILLFLGLNEKKRNWST